MNKKIIPLFLAGCMIISFTACSGKTDSGDADNSDDQDISAGVEEDAADSQITGTTTEAATETTAETTVIPESELYREYMDNALIPELGWTDLQRSPFYCSYGPGYEITYSPVDDYIDAAGILSADIDDYNGDGTDDMIVIYMYEESAGDVKSFYTMFRELDYLYRTGIMAFTVSDGKVVKTDEYDVLGYGNSKEDDSIVGCLLHDEPDKKDFGIYKVSTDTVPVLFLNNDYMCSPAFRYEQHDSWMIGINKEGKFIMLSSYMYSGSGMSYNSLSFEFSDGVEETRDEGSRDAQGENGFYYKNDYCDDHQIAYEDEYADEITENDEQVILAYYSFDYDIESDAERLQIYLTYIDGGNLSQEIR
jgi:hypothetical protein